MIFKYPFVHAVVEYNNKRPNYVYQLRKNNNIYNIMK